MDPPATVPTATASAAPSRSRPARQYTVLPVWVCPVQSFGLPLVRVALGRERVASSSPALPVAAPPLSTIRLTAPGGRCGGGRASCRPCASWWSWSRPSSWWSSFGARRAGRTVVVVVADLEEHDADDHRDTDEQRPEQRGISRASRHVAASATALLPTHGVILPGRSRSARHRLPGSARRPSMRSRRLCSRRRRTRRTVSGSYASASGRSTSAYSAAVVAARREPEAGTDLRGLARRELPPRSFEVEQRALRFGEGHQRAILTAARAEYKHPRERRATGCGSTFTSMPILPPEY